MKGKGKGDFFMVDQAKWASVCELGMNAAVAYIVLARFSAKNNRDTRASTNAVEHYTGIARGRAKKAIGTLVERGLAKQTQGGARPRYELIHSEEPFWIWLPNTLVDGAAGETPPIELVRQTQDLMCLRLFVDLYSQHSLREDGGVERRLTWARYDRSQVYEHGPFVIWGFERTGPWVRRVGVTECHHEWDPKKQKHVAQAFFQRLDLLIALGLVEWIPYLYESENDNAEPIHPYGTGSTDSIEDRLGAAALAAAEAMVPDWKLEQLEPSLLLVPVLRHRANVTMIGIARLRYRPHTRATSAWWAELHTECEKHLRVYEALAEGKLPSARVAG